MAHDWMTSPSTPFCEAFAFIDSSPFMDIHITTGAGASASASDSREFYHAWKISFLDSLFLVETDSENSSREALDYNDGIRKATDAAMVFWNNANANDNSDSNSKQDSSSDNGNDNGSGGSTEGRLLDYALATRAHAPTCEMQNSLAQAALAFLPKSKSNAHAHPRAFVIWNDSYADANSVEYIALQMMEPMKDVVWANLLPDEGILYQSQSEDRKEKGVAILYGPFDAPEFATLYHALVRDSIPFVVRHMHPSNDGASAKTTTATATALQGYGVRLDIRNVEYTSFDDKADSEQLNKDIEAKQIDQEEQEQVQSQEGDQLCHGEQQVDDARSTTTFTTMDEMLHQFINGIDPTVLAHPTPLLREFFQAYLPHMESMITDDIITNSNSNSNINSNSNSNSKVDHAYIPPKAELKQLAVQAATVISQSKDPLWTMQVLAQNLPSFAAVLGNVTVPSAIVDDLERSTVNVGRGMGTGMDAGTGGMEFHVNGRKILVERPSFNVFELINAIREEQELLRNVGGLGLGGDTARVVGRFLAMGKDAFRDLEKQSSGNDYDGEEEEDYPDDGDDDDDDDDDDDEMGLKTPQLRIDVGSGYKGAVVYLNDIERDVEYRQWPTKIEQAMYAIQFGQPLVIRRNLMTVLLVLDPFDEERGRSDIFGLLMQMMQNGTPMRVGIVFASNKDIEACRDHLHLDGGNNDDCVQSNIVSLQDDKSLLESKVTAEMIMKIFQHVVKNFGKEIGFPYLFLLNESVQKGMTVQDIVGVHTQVLMRIGAPVDDPINDIVAAIQAEVPVDSKADRYAKALKFAVMKNIRPGMAFVNGIPLPSKSPQDCQTILMEEMQRLVGMMLTEKITDSSPRSVYAMLLKGDNVRSAMHPLLADDSPVYRVLASSGNEGNVVVLQDSTAPEMPRIMITIVADLLSIDGLTTLSSSLTSISTYISESKSTETKGQSSIAMRIIPSDAESSSSILGALVRGASKFLITELIEVIESALKAGTSGNLALTMGDFDCGLTTRNLAVEIVAGDKCSVDTAACVFEPIGEEYNATAVIFVNGRVYVPDGTVHTEDIGILIDLERGAAKTITKYFAKYAQGLDLFTAVSRAAEYLGSIFSSESFNSHERSDIFARFKGKHVDNLLRFSWNAEEGREEVVSRIQISILSDLAILCSFVFPTLSFCIHRRSK